MKQNETEFVIDLEGLVYVRDVNYRLIDPGEAMQKAFLTSQVTKTQNLLEIPGHGFVNVTFESATNIQYWSVPMQQLVLRTTFKAGEAGAWNAGEFYPSFAHKDSGEVPMEVIWNKADGMANQETAMHLRFIVEVARASDGHYVRDHYLYAFDGRKAAYKLPLGNLYENCRLCMGQYDSVASTALGSVMLALEQFKKATWNSDLFTDESAVARFFRFKPLESGFQTLPIIEQWADYCSKVATPNLRFIDP